MRIIDYRPAPSGSNTIAHIDIEIVEGVRLYGLRVAQMPDKSFRVFGPNTDRCGRSMSFDPAMVNAIAHATISYHSDMYGHSKHDQRIPA